MSVATPRHVADLEMLLAASKATPEFAAAAVSLARDKRTTPLITYNAGVPLVKAVRVVCQALETLPNEPITSVRLEATSGCSDLRGTLVVQGATTRRVRFVWDCAWKAESLGWRTMFGDWDQQRAAQEFGYRCFEVWEEE